MVCAYNLLFMVLYTNSYGVFQVDPFAVVNRIPLVVLLCILFIHSKKAELRRRKSHFYSGLEASSNFVLFVVCRFVLFVCLFCLGFGFLGDTGCQMIKEVFFRAHDWLGQKNMRLSILRSLSLSPTLGI